MNRLLLVVLALLLAALGWQTWRLADASQTISTQADELRSKSQALVKSNSQLISLSILTETNNREQARLYAEAEQTSVLLRQRQHRIEELKRENEDLRRWADTPLPEITGGRLSLLALEQMAEQGKAWPLIEGSGTIYGMYVIEGLNQTKTEFFRDGMPRRIEFTLSLKRVDESLSDMFGDLSAQLNNLQDTATSALSDISKTVGGLLS